MFSTFALDTQVLQTEKCTGCGACQGLCPYWDSVRGRTITYFDCERTDGRCQRFCPAMPTDREALMKKLFPGADILPEIGPYRGLYLTQAADPAILEKAQHGGTVTALMKLALEEGMIDAAVLTGHQGTADPEGRLITDPSEITACSGSSYQIPPTLAVLNRALKTQRYHRIGVVGTPCKTLAVSKMFAAAGRSFDHKSFEYAACAPDPIDPDAAAYGNHAEDIGLVVGLFCGWGLDWEGVAALLSRYADPAKVTHVDIPPSKYHCMKITEGGRVISVDLDEVNPLVRKACLRCPDMTAEFSDLSVGGARSADGWEVDKKWNQVIVRTRKGEELIRLAKEKGILRFKEVPAGALDKIRTASAGKKARA